MDAIIKMLVGTSWKSSVAGLCAGLAIAGAAYAQSRSEPIWYVVGLAFVWLGRVSKDWDKSNAPSPVASAVPVPEK